MLDRLAGVCDRCRQSAGDVRAPVKSSPRPRPERSASELRLVRSPITLHNRIIGTLARKKQAKNAHREKFVLNLRGSIPTS